VKRANVENRERLVGRLAEHRVPDDPRDCGDHGAVAAEAGPT
jgi:hypothetical protein